MAKTIVFKPEFEAKLKKLKIKTKFVSNIKKHSHNGSTFNEQIAFLNTLLTWNGFIRSAFVWSETPEGSDFWFNLLES